VFAALQNQQRAAERQQPHDLICAAAKLKDVGQSAHRSAISQVLIKVKALGGASSRQWVDCHIHHSDIQFAARKVLDLPELLRVPGILLHGLFVLGANDTGVAAACIGDAAADSDGATAAGGGGAADASGATAAAASGAAAAASGATAAASAAAAAAAITACGAGGVARFDDGPSAQDAGGATGSADGGHSSDLDSTSISFSSDVVQNQPVARDRLFTCAIWVHPSGTLVWKDLAAPRELFKQQVGCHTDATCS
jgi:hypothetical protein